MVLIELIAGPMTSNKTGTLISKYLEWKGNKRMINNTETIKSRNGNTTVEDCITHDQFISAAEEGLDEDCTYFIDEGQFIRNLYDIITNSKASFFVSMLDCTFTGEYWLVYPLLYKIAERVILLRAKCTRCNGIATKSMLISETETLNKESYHAVCEQCFVYPTR